MKHIWYFYPHMEVKYLAPNLSGIIERALCHSNISVIFCNYFITKLILLFKLMLLFMKK